MDNSWKKIAQTEEQLEILGLKSTLGGALTVLAL